MACLGTAAAAAMHQPTIHLGAEEKKDNASYSLQQNKLSNFGTSAKQTRNIEINCTKFNVP